MSDLNILKRHLPKQPGLSQTHCPSQSNLCLGKSVGNLPFDYFSKVCFLPQLITMTPKPYPVCSWCQHSWGASERQTGLNQERTNIHLNSPYPEVTAQGQEEKCVYPSSSHSQSQKQHGSQDPVGTRDVSIAGEQERQRGREQVYQPLNSHDTIASVDTVCHLLNITDTEVPGFLYFCWEADRRDDRSGTVHTSGPSDTPLSSLKYRPPTPTCLKLLRHRKNT